MLAWCLIDCSLMPECVLLSVLQSQCLFLFVSFCSCLTASSLECISKDSLRVSCMFRLHAVSMMFMCVCLRGSYGVVVNCLNRFSFRVMSFCSLYSIRLLLFSEQFVCMGPIFFECQ